jgi:hypothetical protein
VRQILERHLVVGQELSINNLTSQGRDNYLQTIRGKVKIVFVESGGGKYIQFNPFHTWIFFLFFKCTYKRTIKLTILSINLSVANKENGGEPTRGKTKMINAKWNLI